MKKREDLLICSTDIKDTMYHFVIGSLSAEEAVEVWRDSTDEDIVKITSVVATKEDIEDIKKDVNGLRESIQALTVSVDKLVKSVSELKTEYTMVKNQLERHEKWFQQVANKIGIRLEH